MSDPFHLKVYLINSLVIISFKVRASFNMDCRFSMLNNHLAPQQTLNAGKVSPVSDDDVVIIGLARTAMTKAKRGMQKDTAPEAMLAPCFGTLLKQSGLKPEMVEDICIGNVLQVGSGMTPVRIAQYFAGFPDTTTV